MNGALASEPAPDRSAKSGLAAGGSGELVKPDFAWPKERAVHLVARDIRRRDAVGEFCLQLGDLLRENGIPTCLHAENWDPLEIPSVEPTAALARRLRPADLIFFHFSTMDPALPAVADLPARKVFYFHGVTPPEFFEGYDPAMATCAREGLGQLSYALKFDRLMGNSRASVDDLRRFGKLDSAVEIAVCPPVLGIRRWASLGECAIALPPTERFILYVGRLAPNKAVHRLLLAFGDLGRRDRRTGLVVVGQNTVPSYGRELAALKASMPAEIGARVAFVGDVDIGSLRYLYERAALFVTLSEHEGFCLPVLEALHFGLPVLAGQVPAIRELLGSTGPIAATDPATVAGAMGRLLDDAGWRRKILGNQQARFAELARMTNGAPIWQAFRSILGSDARPI